MARQEKLKQSSSLPLSLCPSPLICVVYPHYALTKLPSSGIPAQP